MGWLEIFFDVSIYAFLLATIVYGVWFFWQGPKQWIAACSLMGLGVVSQVAFIVAMGFVAGRPPFANTFETLVLFAACVAGFYLFSARNETWRPLAPLAALSALFVTLLAYLMMQDEMDPLVPALRNNFWLTTHVAFCFVSYAAFLLSYVGALARLAKNERHAIGAAFAVALNVATVIAVGVTALVAKTQLWENSRGTVLLLAAVGAVLLALALWFPVGLLAKKLKICERLPEESQLERLVYKAVAFAFPFLTLGIVTGSYWASQAWGRYWGWDDKEVASLITWLVFAVYLHLRLVPKWRGPWVAWIAVAGFWCVLFTYFGVNYLMSGLHSYG